MNRAERRRLKKSGKPEKDPVLQIKTSALESTVKNQVEAKQRETKQKIIEETIKEVNQQILQRDLEYSLDIDTMILWTLHAHYGWGKKRLEDFYEKLLKEHTRMREYYQIEDLYPERAKLKDECGVDVVELNQRFQHLETKGDDSANA